MHGAKDEPVQLLVVQNWFEELKRLASQLAFLR
jgi:hypothetical protein